METRSVYPVDLELRQDGERPVIAGRFPYGGLAIIGTRRQERFMAGAFAATLRDGGPEINFLLGHDMARPLASRNAGTLVFEDSTEALEFRATLPVAGQQTTWQRDFPFGARSRTTRRYFSPGFNVFPKSESEADLTLRAIPGTTIRTIRAALLGEVSAVTRAAYPDATLEARDDGPGQRYWQLHPEALRWLVSRCAVGRLPGD